MTLPHFLRAPFGQGELGRAHLARVVSVADPDGLNRVQVAFVATTGSAGQDGPVWARVAVPCAGASRGTFFIPGVDDEVLVVFVDGDSRFPVVVGGLWNGADQAPETLGGSGQQVDRWTITGTNGTRIAIVEEQSGQEQIELTTPGGVSALLTDEGGGKIELKAAGTTVTIDSSGVSVQCPSQVKVSASTLQVDAGQVTVNAGMSRFSGVVQCDTLIATTVVGSTYTPGAGNVW